MEVGRNMAIEPLLQPHNGEVFRVRSTTISDEARSDIRAAGFWTRKEDAFITDALARGSLRQQAHQVRAARQAPTMH